MARSNRPWGGVALWVWGLGCLGVAVVYAFLDAPVVPGEGIEGWLTRWGHSACWMFLGASFFCRLGASRAWVNGLATTGGLVYLAFLVGVFW